MEEYRKMEDGEVRQTRESKIYLKKWIQDVEEKDLKSKNMDGKYQVQRPYGVCDCSVSISIYVHREKCDLAKQKAVGLER